LSLTNPAAADVFGGAEYSYSSGDFGTGVDSSISVLSLRASVVRESFDATVTVPFVSLDTESADSNSGLGDVTLRAGVTHTPRKSKLTSHAAIALKLPTASEDDGLGTGEPDVGVFGGVNWPVGAAKATLGAGYVMVGDPEDFDYDDVVMLSVGVMRNFTHTGAYASLDYRSAMIDGSDDPLELSGGVFRVLDRRNALSFSGFLGLSDGSADFGVTVGVTHRF
jgi:hypothetical protein